MLCYFACLTLILNLTSFTYDFTWFLLTNNEMVVEAVKEIGSTFLSMLFRNEPECGLPTPSRDQSTM